MPLKEETKQNKTYLTLMIIYLHTVIWFQAFLSHINNFYTDLIDL